METKNITLSLPKDILLQAKLVAVQHQTSVSSLLTEALTRIVEQEERYTHAQQWHQLSFWDAMILASAMALGCEILWSEDLYPGHPMQQ